MSASTTTHGATTHEAADGWQSRAGEYAERGSEMVAECGEAIESQIRSKPLAAVLIAGGVGFLLGWFWTRRS